MYGIATTEEVRDDLRKAGIELAEGAGSIGGPTGALLEACHRGQVPAAGLIVQVQPQLPDPGAARDLIENALEPLVQFDIDTSELKERAEEIQAQKEKISQRLQGMLKGGQDRAGTRASSQPQTSMYR